ncbi:MAG: ABC transporter ATP-binding protein [Planctomycetaceae bacterium]|nr:MAG: ABC transporter ATP-binding protein [Planctomycetaceae bacterium]
MNTTPSAIDIRDLTHRYGLRVALADLTLQIEPGEMFAILGPNGCGKTTLFRLLSTLMRLQSGSVYVLGKQLPQQSDEVRRRIGVVFQSPSLDRKLTVGENLRFQAALYGIRGRALVQRQQELLDHLGLADRIHERTEHLSGGLRRRVELAKGMLHRPSLLLLDEPSTGLDPGARTDLWRYLEWLRDEHQVTVVLTTHLLDEAERADRIAIFSQGRLVALDHPEALKASIGGDSITIRGQDPATLRQAIADRFQVTAKVIDGHVRFEHPDGAQILARVMEAFSDRIQSITLGRPSLEDVFIDKTGHRFWSHGEDDAAT